jgi:hypothetical protein
LLSDRIEFHALSDVSNPIRESKNTAMLSIRGINARLPKAIAAPEAIEIQNPTATRP